MFGVHLLCELGTAAKPKLRDLCRHKSAGVHSQVRVPLHLTVIAVS